MCSKLSEHVVKIEPSALAKLRRILLENKNIGETKITNSYEEFRLECDNGFIIGYSSGKIVATNESARHHLTNAVLELDQYDNDIIIGSDEAGKGEWLGPLVIVAVALTPSQSSILRAEGIMDSKELGTEKIMELAKVIKHRCAGFKVVLISPKKFNDRMIELKHEQRTLNDLMAWGHAKAIQTVYSAFKEKSLNIKIVIDEFDKLKTEIRLQRVVDLKEFELIQKPKAEEEIAVAAASIIARSEREIWIDREAEQHGIALRKFSPSQMLELGLVANLFAKINYIKK